MGIKETLASSALGSVQKAMLIIHQGKDAQEVDSTKVAADTALMLKSASASTSAKELGQALNGPQSALTSHVMQVQYNPASLSIQANAEAVPFTYLQQNIDSGIPNQSPRPPMVVLSVELIFDAVNPADAFMLDKLRLSAGSVVSDISGAIQAKQGGYTVQPHTNGLVAALMRPSTRVVTFRWADMAFTGQLIEVQAVYTMFSVSGKPVRSHVRMNIAQQVESSSDLKYWDGVLDRAFSNNNTITTKDASSNWGNIFNLDAF
jgi:hypothetical protein